jgi:hypothetical protein
LSGFSINCVKTDGASVKTTILILAILLATSGGRARSEDDGAQDAVIKDMLGLMQRATKVLAGVTNEKTLKAATPKLKKIGQERRAIAVRYKKLKLSKEEAKELKKKYQQEAQKQQGKLYQEMARVKKIPGGKKALKLLDPEQESKKKE